MSQIDFNITDRNTELPFFPSKGTDIVAADVDAGINSGLQPFDWIEAFYDAAQYDGTNIAPAVIVWDGVTFYQNNLATPQATLVYFAFSGARINFKGRYLLSAAVDYRGNVITATPIGTDPVNNIAVVHVDGGMY